MKIIDSPMLCQLVFSSSQQMTARYAKTVISLVFFTAMGGGSAEAPVVKGTAFTVSGAPISQVLVVRSTTCCPVNRQETKTDESGRFELADSGDVLYFRHQNFRPVVRLLGPGETEIRVVLENAEESNWVIQGCPRQAEPGKRVGHVIFSFLVPRGSKVRQGVDVDYHYWYVRHGKEPRWMRIMEGPTVTGGTSAKPWPDWLKHSAKFEERWIVDEEGGIAGMDARGELNSGRKWRELHLPPETYAVYHDVDAETAAHFDKILDSVCILPPRAEKSKND